MDYYGESDGPGDHKVMTSTRASPRGSTLQKSDYKGKSVYLCVITASEIAPFLSL